MKFECHTTPPRTAAQAEACRVAKVSLLLSHARVLRSTAKALESIAKSGETDRAMTDAANLFLELTP